MQVTDQSKKKILVVEDEGLVAADIQRRLERMGYAASAVATSGEEALECARTTQFDLVLMDIRLNGKMDGIAAAQALKDQLHTPVLYMTAHSDEETIERAKLTEPLGYVLKPIGDANLRSAVHIAIYKHEMERRLRTSEAWLSTTMRSVGEGVIATDTSGEIVFMNPVAEQLTGWPAKAAHGRLLMDVLGLFEESTGQAAKNPIFDLLPGENRTYRLISRTGVMTSVEIGCFENRSADDLLGAIVIVRDIHARRELENRLIQSQRMEAIARTAGFLAHDFNNQLAVIHGYADELCSRPSNGDRQPALEIKQAASSASSMASQLLMLSRREAVQPEALNINDAIRDMQPVLSRSLGAARTLDLDFGSPAGFVRADRNQFKQVLLNLTLNARDAMPSGGQLRIETSLVDISADSSEGRLHRPGPYVRIRVIDSGEGMDQATLHQIFEPFCTTKKAGPGTGLGLSIVHSIVVQSGGYISATSEIGQATTFEILLPGIGSFQPASGALDAESLASGPDPTRTVLFVEDEYSILRLVHGYLETKGLQFLEARNAEDAELIASVYQQPIHVLVTDVVMPGKTGPQLAETLRSARPDLKVLYISGYRRDRLETAGVPRDASILTKPFPPSQLLRRIRLLLN
jgi:PAS domain S-box-containing protein